MDENKTSHENLGDTGSYSYPVIKQERYISKAKVTFIELALSVWTVATLWLSSMFGSGHLVFSIASGLSGVSAGVYAAYLHYIHKLKEKENFSAVPFLAFLLFELTCFAIPGLVNLFATAPERFHVTLTTMIRSSLSPDSQTPFKFIPTEDLLLKYGLQRYIVVQLIISIIVENEQKVPATILAFGLETGKSPSGPWRALCPVNTMGRHFFWSYEPEKSTEFSADDFADRNLLNVPMPPNATVTTKTAWECPGTCEIGALRIEIFEASGRKSSVLITQLPTDGHSASVGTVFSPTGAPQVDLSRAIPEFEPDCRRSLPPL